MLSFLTSLQAKLEQATQLQKELELKETELKSKVSSLESELQQVKKESQSLSEKVNESERGLYFE